MVVAKKGFLKFMTYCSVGEANSDWQKVLYYMWNILVLLLSSAVICICTVDLGIGPTNMFLFSDILHSPLLILLNFLPVFFLQLLFLCLFNRQWAAYLASALIFILSAIGNYYKIKFRFEPFMFSDLTSIAAGFGVAGNYDLTPGMRIIFSSAAIVVGTLLIFFLCRGRLCKKSRIGIAVFILLLVCPLWLSVYSRDTIYHNTGYFETGSTNEIAELSTINYTSHGFVYAFIHSISYEMNTAPAGYSSADAAADLNRFSDCDIPADKRVNVLAFQLESFNDFTRLGMTGLDEVYAPYHSLEEESYTGNIIVNIYGGGTVDTERSVLTGNYSVGRITKPVYSHIRYLNSQGYLTTGSHPNRADFYNRMSINSKLGFDEYYFLDHYEPLVAGLENTWQCDSVFFPEVLRLFTDAVDSGKSVFSFNIGLQGHSPYSSDKFDYETRFFSGSDYSQATLCSFNNYLGSLADTQKHLTALVDKLRTYDEPVVLLLYGDHNPHLGDDTVYNELGLVTNPSSEKDFYDYYSTRYLIWANDAAKEITGSDFTGEGPTVSACYMMNLLFDQLGWEGSQYMQYNSELMKTLPVISSKGYYVVDGKFTSALDEKAQELFNRLQNVQYYIKKNYQVSD